LERYLQATAATTSATFQEDGVTVDPGVVTLTLTREDGTVIATGQATGGSGAAARTFNLTAATHLVSLDVLRLDWLSATKGTQTTYVEVCGGFLFTVSQARALTALANTSTYPVSSLITARTLAEDALEWACGLPFVPRYFRKKVDGTGTCDVLLPARPLSVTSVTYDATSASAGTTLTANELTDLRFYDDGRLYNSARWSAGRQNVEVKGTRGYRYPPPRVSRAALMLAKRWLVDTSVSDRATAIANAETGTTQFFVTAGGARHGL
jgi:hypothetical protein